MGYMSHNAIIVTGWREYGKPVGHIDAMRDYALALGCQATECVDSHTNGYVTFVIVPDGSKEGWSTSNNGDARRKDVLQHLKDLEEKGIYLDWVEVQYGNDDGITKIVAHSDEDINPR